MKAMIAESRTREERMAQAKRLGATIDGLIFMTYHEYDGDVYRTARHFGLSTDEVLHVVRGQ
jgi:hypothetical protein